ncbi:MAG: ornithine carbamoyltransferase [Thermoleophilia bacterium]|nr:ornithine carbamoyltransferase [Thermoleophilia bacterium]
MVPAHLKGRDLLRIDDWSAAELAAVLELAVQLKAKQRARAAHALLPGRAIGLVFEKPSTRTRVSFAVGIAQLGGTAVPLSPGEMQLGRGETIRDTGLVLSRYLDAVMVRTFSQAWLDELAGHATIPVVNGLTDEHHPCQALADALTIVERFGELPGVRVAYVGDGNNVCHSLVAACAALGADVVVATPSGYEPDAGVVARARAAAESSGGSVELVGDPREAARGADVLYTDVWTSMGQDDERERRLADFAGFRVDESLLALASERAVVMHDLPAHYGEEVTESVLHGPRSAAWDQAENRLHAQKALLALIVP